MPFDLESQKKTPRCRHSKTSPVLLHSTFEFVCCGGICIAYCTLCSSDLLEIFLKCNCINITDIYGYIFKKLLKLFLKSGVVEYASIFKLKKTTSCLKSTDTMDDQIRQSVVTILVIFTLSKLFNTISSGFKLVENDRKLETILRIPSSVFQQIFLWELIEALLLFVTTKPKKIMEEN